MSDDPQDPVSSFTSSPEDLPEVTPFVGWPRWRRPVLVLSGASLLTIGVIANRAPAVHGLSADPSAHALPLDESVLHDRSTQFVMLPDEASEGSDSIEGGRGLRHRGEEGKMGKATPTQKSGLYALKGGQSAGILGHMQQESGHFLASPYGGSTEVGVDDEDVWGGLTGTEIGEAYGVGGLGLIGTGQGGGGTGIGYGRASRSSFDAGHDRRAPAHENAWVSTTDDVKSTFSIDVDTASYSSARRFLREGQLPPPDAVRIEELVNYFSYDYAPPEGDVPFSVTSEVGSCPWNPEHRLVHIGLQGKVIASADLPPRNLVFLIDVSGSMMTDDRLPLVKRSLAHLVEHLSERDQVALVVYAGAAGVVLKPTSGAEKATILEAIGRLEAGGSTNGGEGIQRAYALARQSFVEGGINRVVLASDGDFNVGVTSQEKLVELIERERKSGVYLSVLGYGMGNYQDATMEQLADKGNGNYAYIDSLAEAKKVLVEEAGGTLVTIAKDVKLQVELDPKAVERFRLVGYENRVLAHRDFADDTKDAGEIGAGHTVTALYEVVPRETAEADRLMTLNIRYKPPEDDQSLALSFSIADTKAPLDATSNDFRWSAAVASFGLMLRNSAHKGAADWASTRSLALEALGADPMCRRHEMVELVGTAARLAGSPLPEVRLTCTPGEGPPSEPSRPALEPTQEHVPNADRTDATAATEMNLHAGPEAEEAFWLGVLRLLPPLLAFPLFILAWRDPYRRRVRPSR